MDLSCDVLIVGGGTGGVAAALSSCEAMAQVIICEESDWLGGQLTSQMVPPDENKWIEDCGSNHSYRIFREKIRDYYRRKSLLKPAVLSEKNFNPGGGSVSGLCF